MHKFRRAFARGLVVLAMVGAGSVAVAAPAQAGNPYTCGGNKLCWYEHTNYDGAMYYHSVPAVGVCYNIGSAWDNRISSIVNNFAYRVRMHRDPNCGGGQHTVYQNEGWAYIIANDDWSSWKVLPN